ncbi:hypothetical protein [Tautonia plasticadhaerens]|uniref:Uncharacterized protein n=1 Tax=Tautonia plasticadhaerens TaxID=2527974 RepID=A0A518HA96_9BACT|nr:hypothetical protein [Tautonia plasticadhaerens]QDV37727.1 hypothetical protein ElP_56720 [Tautonia plasticadhaerens]
MREKTTQVLLVIVAALLVVHLFRTAPLLPMARAQGVAKAPAVLRAEAFELVDKTGKVVAQLHLGEDGGGNIRLRSGDGTVRVKLGATADGSGLLLFDKEAEPAVWLAANESGTSATLAEKGKEKRVLKP